MSNIRMGRDPRPLPTSFQEFRASRSQSPEKRVAPPISGSRSRSLSPVKKSPTSIGLASHISNGESPHMDDPTTTMSRGQLMLLAQTPLSDALHFSRTDYAIPIPFKLQMPPKLASRVSPSIELQHMKPRHLIFNGTSYEPLSDASSTHGQKPPSPVKPPSTVANRKKVARFVQNTSAIPHDQLSLIEEKSNNGGSRVVSSKVKRLPSLPRDYREEESPVNNTSPNFHVGPEHQDDWKPSELTLNAQQGRPSHSVSNPNWNNRNMLDNSQVAIAHQSLEAQRVVTAPTMENKSFPASTTFHHNMYMAPSELRIGKRSFSDESCVSSVSSFSSVGDILNFNHAYMSSPNDRGEVRVTSDVMDYLKTGKISRNTSLRAQGALRSKISFDGQDLFSESPVSKKRQSSSERQKQEQRPEVIRKSRTEPFLDSIKQSPQRMASQPLQQQSPEDTLPAQQPVKSHSLLDEGPIEPLVLQNKNTVRVNSDACGVPFVSDSQGSAVEYNSGAGAGFNFPNNATNATNGNKARRKALNQKTHKKSTSFPNHFCNGQIEIPELLESKHIEVPSKEVGEMEPLGVPSAAAVSHLKSLYGESSFDSDSEGSFNSQFHALQARQATNPQVMPASKSQNAISVLRHSSKNSHSRHRSMCNIDFDHNDLWAAQFPKPRPTSMNFAANETADMSTKFDSLKLSHSALEEKVPPQSSFKTPIKINSSKVVLSPTEITQNSKTKEPEEHFNIDIVEAPKRVSYPVDFKDQGSKPEVTAPGSRRTSYYHDFSPEKLQHREYTSPSNSEISSSYKSSRTGHYTESTAPTDNNSVVIDLTKESYDICMINRHDSTTSYKSVIEKTRDGRKVEVVLVEEDEEAMNRSMDRDDLSSIYSHYITGWDNSQKSLSKKDGYAVPTSLRKKHSASRSVQQAARLHTLGEGPKFGTGVLSEANLSQAARKASSGSVQSDDSEDSANSWMPSESNFQIKTKESFTQQINKPLEGLSMKKKDAPFNLNKASFQKPSVSVGRRQSNHFDYHENGNYDFNSFMLQTKN